MDTFFRKFSHSVSSFVGNPVAFFLSVALVVIWALSGPLFSYSDTWQLTINTGTTIVTFLIVFLIQNTQNRDTKAINLKLDELIVAVKSARNSIINVDELSDEKLQQLEEAFQKIGKRRI
jgi:low affinity Fe/Cu permease